MALQLGAQGSSVRSLQQSLLSSGFSPQGVDGVFGANTAAAVRSFQQANHLQVDGKAGTQTLSALRNADSFTPAAATASRTTAANAATSTTAGAPTTHVNTPWYSQFDGSHGYTPGNASCLPTSTAMVRAAGAKPTNQQVTGRNMSSYIDSQLAAGKPVLGTVHHSGTHSGNHVLAITGRGQDAQGTYYTFNDPGTTHANMGVDTNPNNRLRLNPTTGALTRAGTNPNGPVYQQDYALQFVRKNA